MDHDDPLEVAERFFTAIEAGDLDAVRAVYAADVEVWHNHDDAVQDVDANLATLGWVTANLEGLRYTDVSRLRTDAGFVQQHVLRARNRAGDEVAVPACVVVTVDGGRITRLDEYLDSAQVARVTAR